jgi:hypothetical protein
VVVLHLVDLAGLDPVLNAYSAAAASAFAESANSIRPPPAGAGCESEYDLVLREED